MTVNGMLRVNGLYQVANTSVNFNDVTKINLLQN